MNYMNLCFGYRHHYNGQKRFLLHFSKSPNTCSASKQFSDVIEHDLCTIFHTIWVRVCKSCVFCCVFCLFASVFISICCVHRIKHEMIFGMTASTSYHTLHSFETPFCFYQFNGRMCLMLNAPTLRMIFYLKNHIFIKYNRCVVHMRMQT